MKPGSLLTGIVIDILETHVIVHVGLKSEAAVAIQEFVNEKGEIELKVGDEVELIRGLTLEQKIRPKFMSKYQFTSDLENELDEDIEANEIGLYFQTKNKIFGSENL